MRKRLNITGLVFWCLFIASPSVASENTPPERPKSPTPQTPPKPKLQSPTQPPEAATRKANNKAAAQKNQEFNTNADTSGDPRAKGDR